MSKTTRKRWRCFHCNEVFRTYACAANHFGSDETKLVACQIKSYEGHLVAYIRKLEAQLDIYRAEDGDILRSIYAQEADHEQSLKRAEEKGYERGVRDMKNEQPT